VDSSAPDKTLVPSNKGPTLPYESPVNLDKTPSRLNKSLVRKEKIVEAAFAIGAKQGLIGISARSVARDAGVSVGYLYKLFPSKSDIMVAAAERYFERTLYQQLCRIEPGQDYVDYCQKLWDCTATTLEVFRRDWLRGSEDLPKPDLLAAQIRMDSFLSHARSALEQVAHQDKRIAWDLLPPGSDVVGVVEFTLRSLLSSLRKHDADCLLLLSFLRRGLYPIPE
jgi:hypothetical protein